MISIEISFDDYFYTEYSFSTLFSVKTCGDYFPDREWTDLPVFVLEMWINNVCAALSLKEHFFSLNFMDGPYEIECYKKGGIIDMRFLENRSTKKICIETSVSSDEFAKELLLKTKAFVFELNSRELKKMRGVQELRRELKHLELLINKTKSNEN